MSFFTGEYQISNAFLEFFCNARVSNWIHSTLINMNFSHFFAVVIVISFVVHKEQKTL